MVHQLGAARCTRIRTICLKLSSPSIESLAIVASCCCCALAAAPSRVLGWNSCRCTLSSLRMATSSGTLTTENGCRTVKPATKGKPLGGCISQGWRSRGGPQRSPRFPNGFPWRVCFFLLAAAMLSMAQQCCCRVCSLLCCMTWCPLLTHVHKFGCCAPRPPRIIFLPILPQHGIESPSALRCRESGGPDGRSCAPFESERA